MTKHFAITMWLVSTVMRVEVMRVYTCNCLTSILRKCCPDSCDFKGCYLHLRDDAIDGAPVKRNQDEPVLQRVYDHMQ